MTIASKIERKHPLAKCEECPLADCGIAPTQTATGRAKAAIVSRSPGWRDVQNRKPMSNPAGSGKILEHLLALNDVRREDCLVTNVVLCSPPEGQVPPAAIKACSARLHQELGEISLVIAAGSEAVNALIGRGTIEYYRGYRIRRGGRTYVATNNPALVLRDDSTFPNLVKDFRRAFNPLPEPTLPKVGLIEDGDNAKRVLGGSFPAGSVVAADIESRGGLTHKAELVSIQFSISGNEAVVLGERQGLFRDRAFVEDHLKAFLERTDLSFVWHNGIYDTKILRHTYGINARVDHDTLLLSYALDERGGVHELDYLLMEEFGWPKYEPAVVSHFKKKGNPAPLADSKYPDKNANYLALYKYAGHDVAGTAQLFAKLKAQAIKAGVWDQPYRERLLAVGDVLRAMETTGMPYDYHKAADLLELEVQPELDAIKAELREIADKPLLNPASTQQMAVIYYDDFHVQHAMRSRPDKARSTDESARKEIIDGRFDTDGDTNVVQTIAKGHDRYQKLTKQAGTYLKSLIERAELDEESRIYTNLPRHTTVTARLSSREPNLQNVTRTKEGLPDIRGLFYAPDGSLLVSADYSQAELRTIAALSGDPLLTGVYTRGEDLHSLTATRFYGEGFTSEQRSRSKNMNFGVFYWQGPATFQEKHEIPEAEAEKYIKWVWETFTEVKAWQRDEVIPQVHKPGYVQSPFGFRRRFYLITEENRNACYREAINFLPQNIAAWLTLMAAAKLYTEVDTKRAKLCLTVHDSILAQVAENYVEEYATICEQVMVSRPKELLQWSIPFAADVGVGRTWAEAK